jgi:nicotinate-nucleotide adenylyltransferase
LAQTQAGRIIGLLGGTFDPVHNAHLRIALDVLEQLPLDEIRFIPSRRPPHRGQPGATAEQRLAMLQRAIKGQPGFCIDERELQRPGPSYMVDTLHSLRTELPETPLCLILGQDAFRELHTWYRWRAVFELAHLLVLQRPGHPQHDLSPEFAQWIEPRRIDDVAGLHQNLAGCVLFWPVTQLALSATSIRERIAQGYSPRDLLPEAVYEYIYQQQLYRLSAT